jgi:hypothetical protein
VPWEVTFGRVAGTDIDFWRSAPAREDTPEIPTEPRCLLYASPQWASPLLSVFPASWSVTLPSAEATAGAARPGINADVLVLVGTAVDTVSGPRIQVPEPMSAAGAAGDAFTVEPDELARGPQLILVVGEPGAPATGRAEADHQAAADLRGCAHDLMTGGAQTVVLVPSMPAELLLATVRALTETLAGSAVVDGGRRIGPQRGWDVHRAARAARNQVRSGPVVQRSGPPASPAAPAGAAEPPAEDELAELALEITLFHRGDFPPGTRQE